MAGQQVDYFQLFDLPFRLEVDAVALKKAYYKKSLEVHPDHHQDASLEDSAVINEAYKTLKDEQAILKYVLVTHGGFDLEKGNALDPMFLMEMMDLNEKVEAANESEIPKLTDDVESRQLQLRKGIEGLWKLEIDKWSDSQWKQLHKYYLESQYLLRVTKNLNTFASR